MDSSHHTTLVILSIFIVGECLAEITLPKFQKYNFLRKFEPSEGNELVQVLETIEDILNGNSDPKSEKESREIEDYLPSPLCKEIRYAKHFDDDRYEYVPEYIPVVECQGSTNGTIDLTKEHSCPSMHCRQKTAQIWVFRRPRGARDRLWERLDRPREFYNGCECMAIVKTRLNLAQ